ncbi:hypothetical protein C8R44DRAFT_749380 [Mycena epipterygia]|nr:hypothetical protein C8R44DRAFT_749380 [Mycena epipterygia]
MLLWAQMSFLKEIKVVLAFEFYQRRGIKREFDAVGAEGGEVSKEVLDNDGGESGIIKLLWCMHYHELMGLSEQKAKWMKKIKKNWHELPLHIWGREHGVIRRTVGCMNAVMNHDAISALPKHAITVWGLGPDVYVGRPKTRFLRGIEWWEAGGFTPFATTVVGVTRTGAGACTVPGAGAGVAATGGALRRQRERAVEQKERWGLQRQQEQVLEQHKEGELRRQRERAAEQKERWGLQRQQEQVLEQHKEAGLRRQRGRERQEAGEL